MRITESAILYDNPLPQLRSRHSFFPSLCRCADGTLAASVAIGEAFESVDSTSYILFSSDEGKTWSAPQPMFRKTGAVPVTDYCKLTMLPDGRLLALGYAYLREDPEKPIGNPVTGGLLDDYIFYSLSSDNGRTWGEMIPIPCAWGPHAEASAPLTVLADGSWVTPITGFPNWEGEMTGPMCGRLLCSADHGATWQDDAICMAFDHSVTCYEQRLCQLEDGTLVCIGWNEDVTTGQRLPNHYTLSRDGGKTWSAPRSTGIGGQASSLCALSSNRLFALHAIRRDTDAPGIYGYIVDLSDGNWNIVDSALLWAPQTPVLRDQHMAEIFAFLKFGQPSALRLDENKLLMTHWFAENGQYKTIVSRIEL